MVVAAALTEEEALLRLAEHAGGKVVKDAIFEDLVHERPFLGGVAGLQARNTWLRRHGVHIPLQAERTAIGFVGDSIGAASPSGPQLCRSPSSEKSPIACTLCGEDTFLAGHVNTGGQRVVPDLGWLRVRACENYEHHEPLAWVDRITMDQVPSAFESLTPVLVSDFDPVVLEGLEDELEDKMDPPGTLLQHYGLENGLQLPAGKIGGYPTLWFWPRDPAPRDRTGTMEFICQFLFGSEESRSSVYVYFGRQSGEFTVRLEIC